MHYQLPNSKMNIGKATDNPFMFADTGVKYIMDKILARGISKKRLKIKVAGGAQMMNDAQSFNIGKRNYTSLRQLFWKNGMFIEKADVGGKYARTLSLNIADGSVLVKSQGKEKYL